MSVPDWLFEVSWWIYAAIVLTCLVLALIRKRHPAAAFGWSLAIVFLPGIGPLLFLTFGCNRIGRRLRRKMVHRASFAEEHSVDSTLRGHGRRGRPDEPDRRLHRPKRERGHRRRE